MGYKNASFNIKNHDHFVREVGRVNPQIKIIGKYKKLNGKILFEDKYGLCERTCKTLLKNKINSNARYAIDKTEYWINQAIEVHGNKYDYSLVKYINATTKVKIICRIHGIFEQTPTTHTSQGSGCMKCVHDKAKKDRLLTTEEFIRRANKVHKYSYDYSKTKYINAYEKITITCPIHGDFQQVAHDHMNGSGCQKCNKGIRLTNNEFIKKSNEVHNNKYDYSKSSYKSTKIKVCIICPVHGEFWQLPSSHMSGNGCPKCQNSGGEEIINNYFDNLNIKSVKEKTFLNCRYKLPLCFDFYIPKYNLCIEYDGQHHFKSINAWGGENNLKKVQKRDKIKNDYCKENNINLLRIPYWDFDRIEEILKEKLKEIENE